MIEEIFRQLGFVKLNLPDGKPVITQAMIDTRNARVLNFFKGVLLRKRQGLPLDVAQLKQDLKKAQQM